MQAYISIWNNAALERIDSLVEYWEVGISIEWRQLICNLIYLMEIWA